MYQLELLGYRVREIQFVNQPQQGGFSLEHTCNYQVSYSTDKRCNAELTVECKHKDKPAQFSIRAVVDGFFRFTGDEDKTRMHSDTFRILYPYARMAVSNLTVTAGMPPVILPEVNIEKQPIYQIDKNPPKA